VLLSAKLVPSEDSRKEVVLLPSRGHIHSLGCVPLLLLQSQGCETLFHHLLAVFYSQISL
jgi:hypothetical protein